MVIAFLPSNFQNNVGIWKMLPPQTEGSSDQPLSAISKTNTISSILHEMTETTGLDATQNCLDILVMCLNKMYNPETQSSHKQKNLKSISFAVNK